MKLPTIYDIKRDTYAHSPFYFATDTMSFFGQTLRDFKVTRSPQGKIYIIAVATSWTGTPGRFVSVREYIPGPTIGQGRLEHVPDDDTYPWQYVNTLELARAQRAAKDTR